jgi:glyoxylase-like metal-dependent hydrolase (beta-lactamase superfamily II)
MIRALEDGIWSCEQPDGSRIVRQVVSAGDDGMLVVDTGLAGDDAADVRELVGRVAPAGLTVLITHPDSDHLGGTARLIAERPDARVLCGAADLPLVGDPERMIKDRYACFAVHDDIPFDETARQRARGRAGASFAVTAAAPHEEIDLGGRLVVLVPTAGHSPGHTSAWLPESGVLAAGDGVMGAGIPKLDGDLLIPPMYAPPAGYRDTISRVRALGAVTLVTGHDPVIEGDGVDDFLDASERAVSRLATLVEEAVSDQPQTLREICVRVHDAYGGLPPERAADLALTVDGHLAELVDEGIAARSDERPHRYRRAG